MSKAIDVSLAFLERYMENNNISLTDINTFQYEVYPKAYIQHSDLGYSPAYNEFFCMWDGSMRWSEVNNENTRKYIQSKIDKLEDFKIELESNSYLSNKKMKDGKITYNDPDFKGGVARDLFGGYVNSAYSDRDIEFTVSEWLDMAFKKEKRDLNRVEERMKLTHKEAVEKYDIKPEDNEEVLYLFDKFKGNSLQFALDNVVKYLEDNQKRVYISILIYIVSSRIDGLDDKYWYTSIESLRKWRKR